MTPSPPGVTTPEEVSEKLRRLTQGSITLGGEDNRDTGSPLPSEEEWEDLEDPELQEYIHEHRGKLDKVRSFLSIADNQFKWVSFSDGKDTVQIKVKAAIPYSVRERQRQLQEELTDMWKAAKEKAESLGLDPDKVQLNDLKLQRPMYEILASLCLEDPWDDWRTWAYIDRQSGMGPTMTRLIFEKINQTQEEVKSFRRK